MKHEKHPERRRVRASLRPFLLPSAQVLPERTGQHGCGPASASAPRRAAPARGGEAGMNIPLDPRARAPNILPAGGLSLRLGPRARAPALRPDPTAAACDRPARRENGVSPRPSFRPKRPVVSESGASAIFPAPDEPAGRLRKAETEGAGSHVPAGASSTHASPAFRGLPVLPGMPRAFSKMHAEGLPDVVFPCAFPDGAGKRRRPPQPPARTGTGPFCSRPGKTERSGPLRPAPLPS